MAEHTLTLPASVGNPPKEVPASALQRSSVDDGRAASDASPGAAVAPAAPDAAQATRGRFAMSRRQALTAAVVPAAVALGAIAQDDSADLILWRRWHGLNEMAREAWMHAEELYEALPEEISFPKARIAQVSEKLRRLQVFAAAWRHDEETQERVGKMRAKLEAERAEAEDALVRAGITEAEALANALNAERDKTETELRRLKPSGAVGVAAQLHLALDCLGACTAAPDWNIIEGALRYLLPQLPEEMRAAIVADFASAEANAVRFAEREGIAAE